VIQIVKYTLFHPTPNSENEGYSSSKSTTVAETRVIDFLRPNSYSTPKVPSCQPKFSIAIFYFPRNISTLLSFIAPYRQHRKHILYAHNERNIHYKTRNAKKRHESHDSNTLKIRNH